MGGLDSNMFTYYKVLLFKGFMELRKHVQDITYLLEIMKEGSDLPCFQSFDLAEFTRKFMVQATDKEVRKDLDWG